MSDEVYAPVDAMQQAPGAPASDRSATDPGDLELPARDQAELPPGHPGDGEIARTTLVHKVTKLPL